MVKGSRISFPDLIDRFMAVLNKKSLWFAYRKKLKWLGNGWGWELVVRSINDLV